jgi:GntR family transcriptional regulator
MAKHVYPSARLYEDLRKIIEAAEPGERLPNETELARQLGVARATLRDAMHVFNAQGLLYRRQGSGTYVMHPPCVLEADLEVLKSVEALAAPVGLRVSMKELLVEHRPALQDEAAALGLAAGQEVLHIMRTMCVVDNPAAFLVDVMPEDVLTLEDIHARFTGSVLDWLLRRGTPILASARTEITALPATHDIARALGIHRDDVVMRFTSHLCTDTGRVVDYSTGYYLPGYFRFQVRQRIG